MVAHCLLEKIHSGKPLRESFRCKKHDHSRTAADQNGVNKHSESLSQTYLCRMIRLCCCSRAGAEPEPASLENNPLLIPFIRTAPNPPAQPVGIQSLLEDPADHRRDHTEIDHNQKNCDQKITSCHNGNHNVQNLYCSVFCGERSLLPEPPGQWYCIKVEYEKHSQRQKIQNC